MKNRKKRGFTIVELVIVIAVIAILAAVLIPTFSGMIEKANNSADIQLIRQANTVLAAMEAYGTEITFANAKTELEANGIDMTVSPSNENNAFYFLEDRKCYVIWSTTESKISFPEEMTALNWNPNSVAVVNGTYCDTLHAAVNAASAGDTVLMIKDITTDQRLTLNKELTIDFGGHTYCIKNCADKGSILNNTSNGKGLLLKNGTIKQSGTGNGRALSIENSTNSSITLDSITIDMLEMTTSISAIYICYKHHLTLNNTIINCKADYVALYIDNDGANANFDTGNHPSIRIEGSKSSVAGVIEWAGTSNSCATIIIEDGNYDSAKFNSRKNSSPSDTTAHAWKIKTPNNQKLAGMGDEFTLTEDGYFTYDNRTKSSN